jgi:hypothetical protein
MTASRLARLLLAAAAVSGCAATAPVTCAEDVFEPGPPELTCDEAIDAARPALALAGVTSLHFQRGYPCPTGWRCAPPSSAVGYVIARLVDGEARFVQVAVEPGGRVVAEAPMAMPTIPAPEEPIIPPQDGGSD